MRLYSAALYALFWWSGEMKSSTGSSGAYSCSSQPATGNGGWCHVVPMGDEGAGTARLLVALGPMLATMRTSPPRIMLGFPVGRVGLGLQLGFLPCTCTQCTRTFEYRII